MADTIASIVERVKTRANIPDSSPTLLASTLLQFTQEAMAEDIYPWIHGINDEFLLVTEIVPLSVNGVLQYPQARIPFPVRAYGRNLREIVYIDASLNRFNMPLANLEEQDLFLKNPNQSSLYYAAPAFFVRGDEVVLLTNPKAINSGSLEMTYSVDIPTFSTSTSLTAPITNIIYSAGTTTITVASATDFNTAVPASTVVRLDIYRVTTGAYLDINIKCSRSGTTITTTDLSEDDVTQMKAFQSGGFPLTQGYGSDLVMLPAGQNNYSSIPKEVDNYLVICIAKRYYESIGDTESQKILNEKFMDTARVNAGKAICQRVTGESKVIANRRGIRAYMQNYARRRM